MNNLDMREYMYMIIDSIKTMESINELMDNLPSIDTQITSIKSQLKHCKNPLQKLNLEREMNRLIREERRRYYE